MFLPQFFKQASVDGKATDWASWVSSITGRTSKAGVMVNRDNALALSAMRACVTLLAESVAQLPCELYRRDDNGGRQRATDHPLYDVIRHQPNRKDTAFEYFEQSQGCLGIDGNSYSLIERNGAGYVTELIPISPNKVGVLKGPDGMPYYKLIDYNEILPMRLVHHVKSFSMDGYVGLSPLHTNADVIGLGMATEEHAAQVFANGTTMSGVIESPKDGAKFDSQAKLDSFLNKFVSRHTGRDNAFSVALLQEGMTYKQLAMDNEKAQLIESRNLSVIEVCRLYKVPPHMVQQVDKTTSWGSGIEQMSLGFVMYTLLAWLKRHEAAMMRDLLLPAERKDLYIEFNISGLLRGDQKSRYEAYALGRQWGWLSVNDIRRMENMPPIPGGDKYLTPLNMADSAAIQQSMNATPDQMKEIEAILCRN